MNVVEFLPEHIAQFKNYGGQDAAVETFRPEDLHELKVRSAATSVTVLKDGQPIACGGIAMNNPYRGLIWAIFQRTTPQDFLFVHRTSLRLIERAPFKRIEAFVDPSFIPAMRWIKLLGFTMERVWIPYFFHNGAGASAWALHKE